MQMSSHEPDTRHPEALKRLWSIADEVEYFLSGNPERENPPDIEEFISIGTESSQENLPDISKMDLVELSDTVKQCTLCSLHEKRRSTVFGTGSAGAKLMVIGEAPGENEDRSGLPFVGKAGEYLDAWLSAISLDRNRDVYIANVVKCRPPGNRDPHPEEVEHCSPYLKHQIALVRPQMILCLGRFAAHFILETTDSLSRLRGTIYRYHDIPTLVTYHPSAVLRTPGLRGAVWEDLKLAASYLDLPLKSRSK